MKKKLIQNLLNNTHRVDLRERIAEAIPDKGQRGVDLARQVLAEAVELSQSIDRRDPADLYFLVCSSTAAQLIESLQGSNLRDTSPRSMAIAQTILKGALTSKAGRKKTSDLSRNEQLALAQKNRREKLQGNLKRVDVWISPKAAEHLATIQRQHACKSQAEAIELVLTAAAEGRPLKPAEGV